MCTDNEILDALSESSYIFICFCIASEDFPASNVEGSKELSGRYDAVMVDAYRNVKKRLNEKLMESDIRRIVYVQEGTAVTHILVKCLLLVCLQSQNWI